MPWGLGIAYIFHSYLYFYVISWKFLRTVTLYEVFLSSNRSVQFIDQTLTDIKTVGQSGAGSNGKISRNGTSLTDAI